VNPAVRDGEAARVSSRIRDTAASAGAVAAQPPPRSALGLWRTPLASLAVLSLGLGSYAASRLVPALGLGAQRVYGSGIGGLLTRLLSRVTGAVPVSVAELVLAAYAAWILLLLVRTARELRGRRRKPLDAVRGGALRASRHAGLALAVTYLLWGMNYARPPFGVQAGWEAWDGIENAELVAILERATEAANRAYRELHGGLDDAGEPTRVRDLRALEASIDEGWRRAAAALQLPPAATAAYGPVKWPGASPLVARFGVGGVYAAFTAEATVVRGLPAMRLPFTMAHEKAHQRGVSREADANFLGFVAAAHAPDPLSRYSAAVFAQQQLFGLALFRVDSADMRRIFRARLPGIRRDAAHLRAWYLRRDGIIADFGTSLNNSFLMANGIDHGVEDYRRSVFLLVAWARRNGGDVMPEGGG
jgi:hypothetical protein